jgi:hypothetical protein
MGWTMFDDSWVKRGVHLMQRTPIFEQKKEADSCESASWFKLSYELD